MSKNGQTEGPQQPARGVTDQIAQFEHYVLIQELGRGAQGVVYLAEDTQLHRKVALKMLAGAAAQSPAVRERFKREAEVASKLDHAGICGVHEIGEEQGVPYIAMQYVRGVTLSRMIENARTPSGAHAPGDEQGDDPGATSTSLTGKGAIGDILRVIERSARALHAAHEAGLVHRDVKPANIMITPEGEPVLLDFGLARDVGDQGMTLTETGQILGTPAYLAAEQIRGTRGEIDRRTDVYALGVTLYECLTLKRPFEAQTFEQLFHEILQGVPPPPRKLNPRIPRDLGTVIEVAMERDRARRYRSALEFAEDLRRVRTFEPILAKAAGPLTRVRKWAQRHPARAVAIVSVVAFVLTVVGTLVGQSVARGRAVRDYLARAEAARLAGDFDGALGFVAQAREREPKFARALELKGEIEAQRDRTLREASKSGALAGASAARAESAAKQEQHAQARAAVTELQLALQRERATAFDAYAPITVRAAFARKERELQREELEMERLLQESHEALELAARLESPYGLTSETQTAFASFFFERWREAIESGDEFHATLFRSDVERHDRAGTHTGELDGRGSVRITVVPGDAQLELFRYESNETAGAEDRIPRLVPVPTSGVGRAREGAWIEGFHAGDTCLRISAVEAGSLAAQAQLQPGDLIVRLDGEPCGDGLLVRDVHADGALARAGIPGLARVATLNGFEIEGKSDWFAVAPAQDGALDRLTLAGSSDVLTVMRSALACSAPAELIMSGSARDDLHLLCVHEGVALALTVPARSSAGVQCEATAYPLICAPDNRVASGAAFEADPGSYLLYVRRSGFEDQRYPFVVPRLAAVEVRVELLPVGSTPEGFVHVPAGNFVFGGDPLARDPLPGQAIELPDFFIARRELTNREWFEFIDDPATQQKIHDAPRSIYLPREMVSGVMPRENLGGPTAPVMGVSWIDVSDYLAWRNARAAAAGEPWVYELPTGPQWERAARAADGRAFPWGERFDFANVVGLYRKPRYLHAAPGGFEPRDESPYGVQDLGGHRQEWTSDEYSPEPGRPPLYRWRGGCWRVHFENNFRAASRGFAEANYVDGAIGLRLVARRRN